jgi:hypothetical protein
MRRAISFRATAGSLASLFDSPSEFLDQVDTREMLVQSAFHGTGPVVQMSVELWVWLI